MSHHSCNRRWSLRARHTLEAALACVGAIVPNPKPVVRRDMEHSAIEAVGDDRARPAWILLTELLAAGLPD
jgi:hypothetical protein